MLGDKLFNFKKNVANAQFFDELKKAFGDLDTFLERNAKDIEAIATAIGKTLAFAVKAFATAVRGIGQAVGFVRRQVENLLRALGVDIPLTIEIQKSADAAKELTDGLVKAKSLLEETVELLKKQNQSFSISKELVSSINQGVKRVSKAFAETIVLGKEFNATLKEIAQAILVEIIAKTIERIALLGIEKILSESLLKKEADKDNFIRKQNTNLKRQIALQAVLGAMGGGGGSSLKFFSSGGAVRKGQPTIVGERGAEMFIPNSSGQITQASRGTSNGAVSVNFNINTIDSRGFDQALVENRGTITSIINNALAEKGRGELI
jgi:3-methyladenine DNA glycosylase Tag